MQWEFTLVIKRTKECNGSEFERRRKCVLVWDSDPLSRRFFVTGVKTFDYLCGVDESASVSKDSLEAFLGTDSSGLDLLYDVQETSTVLSRILPTIVNRKAGEVTQSESVAQRSFNSSLFRDFSDCAVGVLDRAFNEDSMRTFEMLDEKHPVSTEKNRLEINLCRHHL